MKKIEIANMLGLSTRQQLDLVLQGKRNFSFAVAKKATELIGGSLELWQDSELAEGRKEVLSEFLEKLKASETKALDMERPGWTRFLPKNL